MAGRVADRPTWPDPLAQLDEILWEPDSIRLLDVNNGVLPGVWAASVPQALAMLGDGGAVAVMGTLRAGVRVVDVDLDEPVASRARNAVLAWASARGYAAITRASGRPGHVHVLIAGVAPQNTTLDQECIRLREELGGLGYRAIDPRRTGTLRTLTSPHRHGLSTGALEGDVAAFLVATEAAIAEHRRRPLSRRTTGRRAAAAAAPESDGAPAVPRPRRRRDLPHHIATYLASGTRWTLGGSDHSGSTYEAIATASCVRAGWTAQETWAAIVTAHPTAMRRARANRRRWIGVWNRAVAENPGAARQPLPADLVDDLAAARSRLDAAAARLGPRARYAPLLVADVILERMARDRGRSVPAPGRDLAVDTGLSLGTVQTAIRWLEASGVLALDRSVLDRSTAAKRATTSFVAQLPSRTTEPLTPEQREVWETPSPSRHTPSAVWSHLPPGAHRAHRALVLHGPLELADVSTRGLLSADEIPTASELRTTTHALRALAAAGLAACDVHGQWTVTSKLTPALEQRAARARQARLDAVTAERAAYRAPRTSAWSIAQAAARKAQAAKTLAWSAALPRSERLERRAHYQALYASQTLMGQLTIKDRLARARARAGIDERAHHDAWFAQFTDDELADRAAIRAAAHRQRPRPAQLAQVAAWDLHRTRWGLPRGPSLTTTAYDRASLPDTRDERDDAYLQSQLPGLVDDAIAV